MQNIVIDLTKIPQNEVDAFFAVCKRRGLDPAVAIANEMKNIISKEPLSAAIAREDGNESEWMTTTEVVKFLGYKSERSVLRMRQTGKLKAAEYPLRPYRFRRSDVIALRDGIIASVL